MENKIQTIENILAEPEGEYQTAYYPLRKETFEIVGLCMDVHNILGVEFSEIVYKDALEEEFKLKRIFFEREKNFKVDYKGVILKHSFTTDFIVMSNILLEIKARKEPIENFYQQSLNYLTVTKLELALIVNFGEPELKFKRLIMGKNAKTNNN